MEIKNYGLRKIGTSDAPRLETATSERELKAALRQIANLKSKNLLLGRELALLARQAANASKFAYHDELTGLPNRRLLSDRFTQALRRAKRQGNQVVVLFLDLDGFKQTNDMLGHPAGDKLLQQVAARLTALIRSSDTVCRYGGDEFVVVLAEFEGRDNGRAMQNKVRARLAEPYAIDGAEVRLTASVGKATYPDDGNELGDLIQASDRAMYRSKAGDTAGLAAAENR